jgi:WhiB family redox-sensing transcriptional regulator
MNSNWLERAECKGMSPEIFFPPQGGRAFSAEARAVCDRCPVRAECLDAGLGETFGIWGATSDEDRRDIRRQRRLAVNRTERTSTCP